MDIALNPVPSPEWQAEYDRLSQDEWLRRKTHRGRRLEEHWSYLREHAAELWVTGGTVLDIGCGPGETLEIARALDHPIHGVDAPDGIGGMGNEYVRMSRLMHERQQIPVTYSGLLRFLAEPPPHLVGACLLINFRGSIEQCLADYMAGDPHHLHRDCKLLTWKPEALDILRAAIVSLTSLLQPNGHILVRANGSGNDSVYNQMMRGAGEYANLKLVKQDGFLLHKFGWK